MSTRRFVVMFSSGAGSWYAARRIADEHGPDAMTLLFADTRTEDEDNYRFLNEAAADIGAGLVTVSEGRTVWEVFNDQGMIGNTRVSNCSRVLKQEPARKWIDEHCDSDETTVVVGIDWTESHRLPAMQRSYAPFTVEAPLCRPPYLWRGAIFAELAKRGIARPRLYDMGFEHANCGGFCVRAGQGQFVQLMRAMPERYAEHEQQETAFRDRTGKDVSILRDRRGGTTQPLTLEALRHRVEANDSSVDMLDLGGCGCFVDLGDAS
jgi:hypothetical protein